MKIKAWIPCLRLQYKSDRDAFNLGEKFVAYTEKPAGHHMEVEIDTAEYLVVDSEWRPCDNAYRTEFALRPKEQIAEMKERRIELHL